jgi:hypothetical protein
MRIAQGFGWPGIDVTCRRSYSAMLTRTGLGTLLKRHHRPHLRPISANDLRRDYNARISEDVAGNAAS